MRSIDERCDCLNDGLEAVSKPVRGRAKLLLSRISQRFRLGGSLALPDLKLLLVTPRFRIASPRVLAMGMAIVVAGCNFGPSAVRQPAIDASQQVRKLSRCMIQTMTA